MTNTQKLITIADLRQASTIAELKQIWERSKQPNSCESPMSEQVAGGKLIEACIKQADTCKSAEEAEEVFLTLVALGIQHSHRGEQLLTKVAMTKWFPLTSGEERKKARELFAACLAI